MSLTYREIHETYPSLEKTINLLDTSAGELREYIAGGNGAIVYVGCGSSYAIAKSLAATTIMELNRPSFAVAGGDLLIHAERYAKCVNGAVLVVISRSGSTSELLMAADALKRCGCEFEMVSICCAEGSKLSQLSRFCLEMPWAFDESVCQTRCVTNMYFCGVMLIAGIAGNKALEDDLRKAAALGGEFMKRVEPLLEKVAEGGWKSAVVLADAEMAGIAEEGALAYKEICQLPGTFYHILDVRHGPMVLINDEKLVVIAVSDPKDKRETDLVHDIAAKGAAVLTYSDTPMTMDGVTNVAFGETLSHAARGIPFILLHQLIAYYKSKQTGADPDAPDGLDAWIKL